MVSRAVSSPREEEVAAERIRLGRLSHALDPDAAWHIYPASLKPSMANGVKRFFSFFSIGKFRRYTFCSVRFAPALAL